MTDRRAPSGQKTSGKARAAATTTVSAELLAREEKVLRMRHGYALPDDLPLEQIGQEHAETQAKLREIELRALQMSGRLDELRREVGLEAEGVDADAKGRIIRGLAAKLDRKG